MFKRLNQYLETYAPFVRVSFYLTIPALIGVFYLIYQNKIFQTLGNNLRDNLLGLIIIVPLFFFVLWVLISIVALIVEIIYDYLQTSTLTLYKTLTVILIAAVSSLTFTTFYYKHRLLNSERIITEYSTKLANSNQLAKQRLQSINTLTSDLNNCTNQQNYATSYSATNERYNESRLQDLKYKRHTGSINLKNIDGSTYVSGQLNKGKEIGTWTYYENGNVSKKYKYQLQGVGAICRDGSRSYSTGRGTCSHHGGVDYWLNDYVKINLQ
jgi:hypothetical protein